MTTTYATLFSCWEITAPGKYSSMCPPSPSQLVGQGGWSKSRSGDWGGGWGPVLAPSVGYCCRGRCCKRLGRGRGPGSLVTPPDLQPGCAGGCQDGMGDLASSQDGKRQLGQVGRQGGKAVQLPECCGELTSLLAPSASLSILPLPDVYICDWGTGDPALHLNKIPAKTVDYLIGSNGKTETQHSHRATMILV